MSRSPVLGLTRCRLAVRVGDVTTTGLAIFAGCYVLFCAAYAAVYYWVHKEDNE